MTIQEALNYLANQRAAINAAAADESARWHIQAVRANAAVVARAESFLYGFGIPERNAKVIETAEAWQVCMSIEGE